MYRNEEEFRAKTSYKMSFKEYLLCDCTNCQENCVHRDAYRRLPKIDGGLSLCKKLNKDNNK